MTETKFVYVIYIASTPEKIWDAIVRVDLARQYWGHENVSDWKPGSKWQHVRDDATRAVMLVGEVIESDRPRRLVITWADPALAADRSKHTRVSFDPEPIGDMTRLTVTHDEFGGDSEIFR